MSRLIEDRMPSSNGKSSIYIREYVPDGEVRGVIQISHGIAEHMERYDAFAEHMADLGYVVAGNDHLGHGRSLSEGETRGYFGESGGWGMVVADMRKLTEIESEKYPGKPCFLLGHSMGSFLARSYAIHYRTGLTGLILSGTGQQAAPMLRGGIALARSEVRRNGPEYCSKRINKLAFGSYNKGISPVKTGSDWLSRDEAVVDKYVTDEMCGYVPAVGLFRDMFEGIRFISAKRNMARIKKDLPVYLISGDRDPVGEYGKGVLRAYRSFLSAGCTDVTLKLYHEGRHEMLNEINRDEVYKDLLAWMESKIGDGASLPQKQLQNAKETSN